MKKRWVQRMGGWLVVSSLAFLSGCSSSPEKDDVDLSSGASGQGGMLETVSGAGPDEKIKRFDLNHDNEPDVWAYHGPVTDPERPDQTRESLIRKEWDFNFDGKVDIRRHFNFNGEVIKDQMDLDFDGRFDVTTFYKGGNKLRQEYDFNFDSKPDYWKFFEKNNLVRTERDRDFNGRVDRWEYYLPGQLDRIGLDEDGDGQIDKWIQQEKTQS